MFRKLQRTQATSPVLETPLPVQVDGIGTPADRVATIALCRLHQAFISLWLPAAGASSRVVARILSCSALSLCCFLSGGDPDSGYLPRYIFGNYLPPGGISVGGQAVLPVHGVRRSHVQLSHLTGVSSNAAVFPRVQGRCLMLVGRVRCGTDAFGI